jgi:hypothetical protein
MVPYVDVEEPWSVVYRCRCRPVTDTVPRDQRQCRQHERHVFVASLSGYRFQGTQKYLMQKGHTLSAQRAPTEVMMSPVRAVAPPPASYAYGPNSARNTLLKPHNSNAE